MNIKERILANAQRVEETLASLGLPADEDIQVLLDAQTYSLLGGGKRIRPFLVNETCSALGGDTKASMPFACALEMIHTYSLIHDDLPCMDDDDMRRGKPTNHKKFGYANALLAGDALLTKAFFVASTNPYVDANTRTEAVRLLSHFAGEEGMIGGQIMDLAGETRPLEWEKLLRLHSMKTGALMECAASLGALAAGYPPDTAEARALSAYAKGIGLAFQVIDDILDVTGVEEEVGKSLKSDAEKHKTTFLTYMDVTEAKQYAEKLTEDAVESLSCLSSGEVLRELAYYLADRTY